MKNTNNEIFEIIKETCDSLSFVIEQTGESSFSIYTGQIDGLTLFLNLEEDKMSFYFLVRTLDVVYNGDRSDIHIVISLMLASFLKVKAKISCSIFDIAHPIIENEIWGRYIYPEQYIDSSSNNIEFIESLIKTLYEWRYSFWELVGCPCEECMTEENLKNERDYDIESNLNNYKNKISRYNIGSRIRPSYSFLYDIDNDLTIIESTSL
ncbi:MAG: hypothetical protein COB60_01300, partial [Flavobacteriaceae bacterium]